MEANYAKLEMQARTHSICHPDQIVFAILGTGNDGNFEVMAHRMESESTAVFESHVYEDGILNSSKVLSRFGIKDGDVIECPVRAA